MKAWLLPALAASFVATAAIAGGIEDGNAGLDALNGHRYDEAIALFTRALRPGELAGDDREFAYLNRGKAYAAKGENAKAVADFKQALRLKPDDDDAKSSLQAALSGQSPPREDADAAPPPGGDPWGLLSAMASQQYYWFEVPGHDPHESYLRVTWFIPQQALSLSVRNSKDQTLICEYQLDPKTGKIIYAALVSDEPQYGTIRATVSGTEALTYVDGTPGRVRSRRMPDGSITQSQETYANGGWVNRATITLAPTSVDELTAQGLMKAKKR